MRLQRFVLELRPGVRGRVGNARLDDARAQPLEIGHPGLRCIAALGHASVADSGRLPEQPNREPVQARLGNRPLGQHGPHEGHVLDAPGHGARRCRASARAGRRRPSESDPTATSAPRPRRRPKEGGSNSRCRCRARARRARRRVLPRNRTTSRRSFAPDAPGCGRSRTTRSGRGRPRRIRAGASCRRGRRRRRGAAERPSRCAPGRGRHRGPSHRSYGSRPCRRDP